MHSPDRRTLLTLVDAPTFVDASRALPSPLHVEGDLQRDNNFRIDFRNRGGAEAVFHVRSGDYTDIPRSYTVEAGEHLAGLWRAPIDYELSVFGPNDFFRHFQGDTIGPNRADLVVRAYYDDDRITLAIANEGQDPARVRVKSAYSSQQQAFVLNRGDAATRWWALRPTAGWYDLTVTIDDNPKFQIQLAGRVSAG